MEAHKKAHRCQRREPHHRHRNARLANAGILVPLEKEPAPECKYRLVRLAIFASDRAVGGNTHRNIRPFASAAAPILPLLLIATLQNADFWRRREPRPSCAFLIFDISPELRSTGRWLQSCPSRPFSWTSISKSSHARVYESCTVLVRASVVRRRVDVTIQSL